MLILMKLIRRCFEESARPEMIQPLSYLLKISNVTKELNKSLPKNNQIRKKKSLRRWKDFLVIFGLKILHFELS